MSNLGEIYKSEILNEAKASKNLNTLETNLSRALVGTKPNGILAKQIGSEFNQHLTKIDEHLRKAYGLWEELVIQYEQTNNPFE